MSLQDTLTLIAIATSIIFSTVSIGITFNFERKRREERFQDNRGQIFIDVRQVGKHKILFLQNIGSSPLKLEGVEWISKEIKTGAIAEFLTEPDLPLFSKSVGTIIGPNSALRLTLNPDSELLRNENFKSIHKCRFVYSTLGRKLNEDIEFKIYKDTLGSGYFSAGKGKEIESMGRSIHQVLKEITDLM